MPEFYMIIARKKYFPECWEARAPRLQRQWVTAINTEKNIGFCVYIRPCYQERWRT